jgi:hypothetical protein
MPRVQRLTTLICDQCTFDGSTEAPLRSLTITRLELLDCTGVGDDPIEVLILNGRSSVTNVRCLRPCRNLPWLEPSFTQLRDEDVRDLGSIASFVACG